MSPHFGRCPCPDNLIQIESGPSLKNLKNEISYSTFYAANPGPILTQSMHNNTFDGTPLGGDITLMSHGFDNPNAIGMLPDIHPCCNSTEEKECKCENEPEKEIIPDEDDVIENLKEEASNEESFNICYVITALLLVALIIAIICKFA